MANLYFSGLIMVSVSVGFLCESIASGFLVLGVGHIIAAMVSYLNDVA